MRSDNVTKGAERAPNRSLFYALGYTPEDLEKPLIAVVSAHSDIVPGHMNLDKLTDAVKSGIEAAGGTPFMVPAIGVCDGIAMGHVGMKYSLASRELICDSVETMFMAHQFDGCVLVPNCDKIVPGMVMAAVRMNVPAVVCSGGPMLAGTYDGQEVSLSKMFEAVGSYKAGMISAEQLEDCTQNCCPGCGSCSGMYTANSMNCLCEAIGIGLPGNGTIPAVYSKRLQLGRRAGAAIMEMVRRNICARDIINARSIRNALTCDMALGCSTNTVLHLLAIAQEAGCPVDLALFNEISEKTPNLCHLAPAGPTHMPDLYAAGGIPAVQAELAKRGLLDLGCLTVTGKTVGENIKMAFGPIAEKVARFNEIGEEMANPDADFDALMEEMGKLQTEIDAADGWDLDSQLEQAMDALQCPDPDTPVNVCSGGERRRVALCKLLLEAPDLLLLDEPTNHLDAESILWLEQFLHQYKGAVIAVTHDRYFMDNVAEWICEVDRGHLYPYKGNYSTYLETKAKRLEIQGAKDAKLAKRLKNELDWVRSSPKARQAKNKARLERYDQMENEARNNKKLDFSEIQIPAGPRLGSTVLEANHIHKAFGERVLIDDLSFTLPRNGIVGVIGPNGVGKSTLFKTIVGLEPLTSGELKIGDTVKISYVDQNREGLDPNKNLWEAVSGGLDFIEVAGVEVPTRAYVASFGFKGADQQKLTGVLSGGERNRLNLALTLKQGGNLLLLDEPTNDLDVETLESLENALLEFPGCAVVISHDRWFLDRVATHILAWEGDDDNPAKWYWFEGNFQAYQENKVTRLGEDAARPHRLHKKLVRG
mgnify:CR=1 FL=1